MNTIRPVSDLRNRFEDISQTVHKTAQPVFLTKNGYGDMVVMSMEAYENLQFESQVCLKLQEAEREAELTNQRYSSKNVLRAMKDAIGGSQSDLRKKRLPYTAGITECFLVIVKYATACEMK